VSRRPPNLLLIMVDQLAAGWLPAYGHPIVKAPTTSALAHGGVVFESAYCPSPLCAPSRAALLTGRLPSRTGVFDNGAELRASLPTIAHHLRAAGYATCLAGKMHFVGPDQLHGFEERLTTDIYPAGLDWTPDWRLPAGEHVPWYHTMESVLSPGICTASMQLDYDDEVAFRAVRRIFDFARAGAREPFFFVVSFSSPHDPWEVRREYWDRYDPDAIDPPAVPMIPPSEADPYSLRLREMIGIDEAGLSDEQVRTARHGYYAAISYVDERIGEVLGALRDAGLHDETTAVLTADHGEMLGERGLWYKMSFFEPSARVPLIVTAPGRIAPGRRAEPMSLLDLAPTFLELAAPGRGDEDMDGSSLVPLLHGSGSGGRRTVVSEYLAEGVNSPAVMIRRGRHKFIACEGDPDQLYDLDSDPHELVNLAGESGHAELRRSFREEVAARWDLRELERRVLESQRERRLVDEALGAGRSIAWDYQPSADASGRYVHGRDDLYELQRRARLEAVNPGTPTGRPRRPGPR
jgi:choline-sulfatase